MKKITFLFVAAGFLLGFRANAGTCTSDTFTSASANSVLTSTKYNADHQTIYDRLAGTFDGGCISDGTIEDGGLNTTDFAVLFNGIQQGCKVTKSDASTLSVDRCIASVNGSFVKTATSNTVTWGCTGCSSETASTDYYVYIKTGSSGTTLNLELNTGAPNGDGYNSDGDKVLAKARNNGSSDWSPVVQQWTGSQFETGDDINCYTAAIANSGSASITHQDNEYGNFISSVNRSALGTVGITFTSGFFDAVPDIFLTTAVASNETISGVASSATAANTENNTTAGTKTDRDFVVKACRTGDDIRTKD